VIAWVIDGAAVVAAVTMVALIAAVALVAFGER
jgi:hypothetical protein